VFLGDEIITIIFTHNVRETNIKKKDDWQRKCKLNKTRKLELRQYRLGKIRHGNLKPESKKNTILVMRSTQDFLLGFTLPHRAAA
jgi:hypothetical protein